jgi:hypothetical protein
MTRRRVFGMAFVVVLPACAVSAPSAAPSVAPPPVSPVVVPVSLSDPSLVVQDAISQCQVDVLKDQVTGMGLVPARRVQEYAPIGGRPPELETDSAAWVVTFSGTVPIATRAEGGTWEMERPTCVVVDGQHYWFATGNVTLANGESFAPPSASTPVAGLPPLAP